MNRTGDRRGRTIGYEDWDETAPMLADVHQRIGSVTKTFTITALLQLAEQGELSLDDPIEDYVPGMPNGDATLYELASMRSGIPSYTFDESFQQRLFSDPNHVWTPEALTDLVRGAEPMYAPGAMTFYSNTNTALLGMTIEKVTGEPIEEIVQQQIIEPLGLTSTVFPSDATFPEPHAQGYTTQGADDGLPVNATDWNPSWAWTAGAMISDIEDLLVWGEALSTGEGIVSPETQAERINSFDFSVPVYIGEGESAPQSASRARSGTRSYRSKMPLTTARNSRTRLRSGRRGSVLVPARLWAFSRGLSCCPGASGTAKKPDFWRDQ